MPPFELEVYEYCESIFKDIVIIEEIPFKRFRLLDNLFISIVPLRKLNSETNLTYFEKESIEHENKGVQLIFLWEDLWFSKREICESRLKSFAHGSIKIHGRETQCQKIEKSTFIDFLDTNHLQVPLNCKQKIGLYHNNTLVAVAGFSTPKKFYRDDKKVRSSELIRFCNLNNHTVIGGLDKLLQSYIKSNETDDIMTYADRDWSLGKSYERLGFSRIKNTPSQDFWIHQKELNRVYPQGLVKKLGSEDETYLFSKGYQKISNSGNIKFIKFLSKI